VQDLAVVSEGPELLLAGRLPDVLVGLDCVEVGLLGDCKGGQRDRIQGRRG